jgi:hypothetical protein
VAAPGRQVLVDLLPRSVGLAGVQQHLRVGVGAPLPGDAGERARAGIGRHVDREQLVREGRVARGGDIHPVGHGERGEVVGAQRHGIRAVARRCRRRRSGCHVHLALRGRERVPRRKLRSSASASAEVAVASVALSPVTVPPAEGASSVMPGRSSAVRKAIVRVAVLPTWSRAVKTAVWSPGASFSDEVVSGSVTAAPSSVAVSVSRPSRHPRPNRRPRTHLGRADRR